MTLTFVCQNCDDSFEYDLTQLQEESKGIKCPSCSKRLPPAEVDELATTLDDLLRQVAALRKRFAISFEVDADDLGAPYEGGLKRAARDEDEEDEEEGDEDEEGALEDEDEDLGGEDDDDRF